MNLEIYQRKDEKIWSTITANLAGGRLSISGHDLGPLVEKYFPDDEYEYDLSLAEEDTRRLFETLGCADETDEKKLQIIKDTFGNDRIVSTLNEYCTKRGINTSFWSWP